MKKSMWAFLVLGLVAAGASGCAKEELPAQQETAATLVQEAVETVKESPTVEGVTSAVQSSTQALIREGNAVVGGVTSAAQSSSQAIENPVASTTAQLPADAAVSTVEGVTTAAQSSTQALIREGTMVVSGVTSAAQSSSQVVAREESTLAAQNEAATSSGDAALN